MQRDEENELVRRITRGDRAAFAVLVQQHQRALANYTRRMLTDTDLADDVVQETFLPLWTQAARYDAGTARLTTWLHNIAHNLCIDSFRRSSRISFSDDADSTLESDDAPDSAEHSRERSDAVRQAVASLPERQRSALILCHYQGLSNRDAAEILDVSVDALESLLARARRRLKQLLEEFHGA